MLSYTGLLTWVESNSSKAWPAYNALHAEGVTIRVRVIVDHTDLDRLANTGGCAVICSNRGVVPASEDVDGDLGRRLVAF